MLVWVYLCGKTCVYVCQWLGSEMCWFLTPFQYELLVLHFTCNCVARTHPAMPCTQEVHEAGWWQPQLLCPGCDIACLPPPAFLPLPFSFPCRTRHQLVAKASGGAVIREPPQLEGFKTLLVEAQEVILVGPQWVMRVCLRVCLLLPPVCGFCMLFLSLVQCFR